MVMANTDAEFEAADQAVWTEMARRILKGAAPDSLDRTDEDGLVTRALYPVDAPDARAATAHLLPAFPHRRVVEGWQVCQPVGSDAANADIHEALGSVIQIIAAIRPAAGPASQSAARHSTSDVARCSHGAGNRTAHS